jgi:hypothetical protein
VDWKRIQASLIASAMAIAMVANANAAVASLRVV